MNGKLIVVVFVILVLGYVFSRSPNPTPDVLANDYATTIATVATVAAYESLSPPKEKVVETEVVPVENLVAENDVSENLVENPLDDIERAMWENLNDMREAAGVNRLALAPELLDGCRKHADNQRKRGGDLWHASAKERGLGVGENCAVGGDGVRESPVDQWMDSPDHRDYMLSPCIEEGAIGRSDDYWVFRARYVGDPELSIKITDTNLKEQLVQSSRTANDYFMAGRVSDNPRTVKTFSRSGKRYLLRRVFK
jgi:uncharacterized protein YkwD